MADEGMGVWGSLMRYRARPGAAVSGETLRLRKGAFFGSERGSVILIGTSPARWGE